MKMRERNGVVFFFVTHAIFHETGSFGEAGEAVSWISKIGKEWDR